VLSTNAVDTRNSGRQAFGFIPFPGADEPLLI
jgi:hypothetical protein